MSDLSDALERRDDVKARYLRDYLKVSPAAGRDFRAFALSELADYLPPERRLGIGVAFAGPGAARTTLGLALRVPRRNGIAHRAAQEIAAQEEHRNGWVDLRVVERISVPSRNDVPPPLASAPEPITGERPPLTIGASVSHPKSPPGSLGAFVRIAGEGEGFISACHVIANGGRVPSLDNGADRPWIYHPGTKDIDGVASARYRIGQLVEFTPLDTASVRVDAAVAVLATSRAHLGNQIPDVAGAARIGEQLHPPPAPDAIAKMKRVAKVGRSTFYREGRLASGFYNDIALDVPGHGVVYYDGMYEIESDRAADFAAPGDSGAAVFDVDSLAAFGLIVGGGVWSDEGVDRMLVYACDLGAAMKALRATWL